jgi:hypothetical protein
MKFWQNLPAYSNKIIMDICLLEEGDNNGEG